MCPAIRERVESFGDTPAYARCYGWVLTFVLFVRMDLIASAGIDVSIGRAVAVVQPNESRFRLATAAG